MSEGAEESLSPGSGPTPGDDVPVPGPGKSSMTPALLISLALLSAAAPLGTDMYLPSFVKMAQDLNTTAAAVQLTLSAFMIGMGVGQLFIGPISDSVGRRVPLIIGSLLFGVMAVACALTPSVTWLIVLRLVMGASGGVGVALARAVVADLEQTSDAAKAFALMMAIQGLAPVIAPVLGGVLSSWIGWRGIFIVLACFCLLMVLAVLFVVPESLPPEKRHSGGPAQMLRDARRVVANRWFVGYSIIFAVGFGVMFSYISASPFVLQREYGLSTLAYSITFGTNALIMAIVSMVTARLVGRFAIRSLLMVGLGILTVTVAGLVICGFVGATLPIVLVLLALTLAGIGLLLGNATALAVDALHGEASGTGSGIMGAAQFLVAGVVSPLVGIGHPPLHSMSLVMGICMAITLGLGLPLTRRAAGSSAAEAH